MISHWGNDRLPLWISRRSGHGVWHPEYRLYNLIFPALIQPIGLGIFGAGLQYHTHYMVLALGAFLNTLGAFIAIPICVIYVIECFTTHAVEASVIMNLYRLVFGLAIPFFIDPWIARVGVGWTFGMSAFFTLFFAFLLALLVWKGESLRQLSPIGVTLAVTDEGKRVNAESVGLSTENHA
ncbi:MAG: hypothetical protein MMC33_008869 [Icmadophila ericetorum]|nr:hypothetical protein [Icmadophila ericetorum]